MERGVGGFEIACRIDGVVRRVKDRDGREMADKERLAANALRGSSDCIVIFW